MAIRMQWHQVEDLLSAQDELAQLHGMLAGALGSRPSASRCALVGRMSLPKRPWE